MDRRGFGRLLAALPFASAAVPAAAARARAVVGARTFTHCGKEEHPFVTTAEAELANQDGRGYLDHMWFGGSFPNYKRLRIRIYVDRELRPSIDMELGLGAGVGFADPFAPWGTRWSGVTGMPSGIFLNYRVPFTTNVRVTAELPEGAPSDAPFWWIVRGIENHPLQVAGFALPATARLRMHALADYTAQPLEEFDLCRAAGAGLVFLVAIAAQSTNFEFLEAQMRAYIDGARNPQFLSSGLEDYFLGTYYFNRGAYRLPQAGLTHKDAKDHSFSAYRFHDEDPVVFSRGLRLTCRCGERRGEKVFGGSGNPQATTYTAYTWTYEW